MISRKPPHSGSVSAASEEVGVLIRRIEVAKRAVIVDRHIDDVLFVGAHHRLGSRIWIDVPKGVEDRTIEDDGMAMFVPPRRPQSDIF